MLERILVATDGSSGSNGAVRLAQRLADRDGSRIDAVAVYTPPPGARTRPSGCHSDWRPGKQELGRVLTTAAERARNLDAPAVAPGLRVVSGPVPPTIVREAVAAEASIILVGIGGHEPLDRWLGTETALRVAQAAHVPVLAVPPGAGDVPVRALVGVDFSPFCEDAARTAAALLGAGGELHLAHAGARPMVHQGEWVATWTEFAADAERQMAALKAELEAAYEVSVRLHVLDGDAVPELLDLAGRLPVDLIAVGSHGRGFLRRLLLGSVSTGLLRRAPCAVLIAPPRDVPAEGGEPSHEHAEGGT
ncbi:MAG TPA: universal stress protein [Longimicrobiaceae bacterium]|nr:universal stress protein [Longimicrobiaceae bacterium]